MSEPMSRQEAGRLGGRPKGHRLSEESRDRIRQAQLARYAKLRRLAEIGRAAEEAQKTG